MWSIINNYVPKVNGDIPPSLMVLFVEKMNKFWPIGFFLIGNKDNDNGTAADEPLTKGDFDNRLTMTIMMKV